MTIEEAKSIIQTLQDRIYELTILSKSNKRSVDHLSTSHKDILKRITKIEKILNKVQSQIELLLNDYNHRMED